MLTKDSVFELHTRITTIFTGAEMVLLWPLCLFLGSVLSIQSSKEPLGVRNHLFDDFRSEMKLTSSVIQKNLVARQSICTKMCSSNKYCLSVNICQQRFCELNSGDIHSLNASITPDESCFYLGMKNESRPRCNEKGETKRVIDNSAICGISLKRHDSFWGPWEDISSVEMRRDCVGSGHGGDTTCQGRVKRLTIERYKWDTQEINWESANEICTNFGGKLFDAPDGTESQLQFLHDKMGGNDFWTGIRKNGAGFWTNQNGEVIADDVIRWAPGEPGGGGVTQVEEYMFARPLMDDVQPSEQFRPLCDLSI